MPYGEFTEPYGNLHIVPKLLLFSDKKQGGHQKMEYKEALEEMLGGYQTFMNAREQREQLVKQKAELHAKRIKRDIFKGLSDIVKAQIDRKEMEGEDYGQNPTKD